MRGVRAERDSRGGGCRSGEYCVMDGGTDDEGGGEAGRQKGEGSGGCYKIENVKAKQRGDESKARKQPRIGKTENKLNKRPSLKVLILLVIPTSATKLSEHTY